MCAYKQGMIRFKFPVAMHPNSSQPVISPTLYFKVMTAGLLCIWKIPGSNLSSDQFVFVMVKYGVFFAVRTELLNTV
jgi:hypothetical protein